MSARPASLALLFAVALGSPFGAAGARLSLSRSGIGQFAAGTPVSFPAGGTAKAGSEGGGGGGRSGALKRDDAKLVLLRQILRAPTTTDTATTTWKGTAIEVVIAPPNVTGGETVSPNAPSPEEAASSLKAQLKDPSMAEPAMKDFFKKHDVNTSVGAIPEMASNNTKPPGGTAEPTTAAPATKAPAVASAGAALAGAGTTTRAPGSSALGGALETTTTVTTTKLTGTARPAPARRVQFITEVPPIRPIHRETDEHGHVMECTPDHCVKLSHGGGPVFIPALEPTEPPPPPPPPR